MRGSVGVALSAIVLACALAAGGGCGADDADTDGDGLSDRDELTAWGTSPFLADTDGDGWSDYAEIIGQGFDPDAYPYRFNPRVADIPQIRLELMSPPEFAIVLVDTKGVSETFTSTDAITQTTTATQTVAQANQVTQSVSTPQTVTRAVTLVSTPPSADGGAADAASDAPSDAPADAPPAPPSSGGDGGLRFQSETDSVADTFNPTSTVQATYTFTDADALAFAETLTNADAYGVTHAIAEASGLIKVTTILSNAGNIGFSVPNLLMSATLTTKKSKVAPVGNLAMDSPFTQAAPIALAPGQDTGPLVFIRASLTLGAVRALIDDASALSLQLSAYQIDDADGHPFAARLTDVAARTALVAIDYGDARPAERFHVATALGRSTLPLGGLIPAELRKPVNGITAGEALADILRIPFVADPSSGLTSVRGVEADPSGAPRWSVRRTRGFGASTTTFDPKVETFDFAAIDLRAGDVLELVFGDAATSNRPPSP